MILKKKDNNLVLIKKNDRNKPKRNFKIFKIRIIWLL